MISVIICSIDKMLLKAVSQNITATIGVEHEIIAIDNLNSNKGICEVYNEGVELAKYPLLCFLHEDIKLKTHDWGKTVVNIFRENKVGLLGVAGSTYRSIVPSGWFPPHEFGTASWRLNIIQGSRYKIKAEKYEYFNPRKENISKVTCIDGVWFCTTKKIAQEIKFDNHLLSGFHGYDIDYSLAVGQHYEVLVSYDILLSHASDGNFNDEWLKQLIKVQHKYCEILPIDYQGYEKEEAAKSESLSLKRFLREIIQNRNFTVQERKNILKTYYLQNQIGAFKYLKFLYKLVRTR
ncbi:Glycosyltransferase like family protein [Pedobacter terrae]|uniref:Glycosyltransferase like family protein n=1 Tax=Pedobacter terrae TaxID=405671 RepID=A0A1G8BIC2_9SPHI|nr:glycosyltransferase [Pedobacter terrae]SDH32773.1 Glycosyltransferase like family protein [Pedobacter terrae]